MHIGIDVLVILLQRDIDEQWVSLVSAARHCPPSCPVGVQINTERANAALLSWAPAQDTRKNPPSGYVLERQEVGTGSQEWLQCLTTDSATSVEILGDSVPCEADYRFRICSLNKYGKSNNVEFPKAVHLGRVFFIIIIITCIFLCY